MRKTKKSRRGTKGKKSMGQAQPESAPVAGGQALEEKGEKLEAHRRQRICTCRIIQGGMLEASGVLKRVRWALAGALTEEKQKFLDRYSNMLFTEAVLAEVEAASLETPEEKSQKAGLPSIPLTDWALGG